MVSRVDSQVQLVAFLPGKNNIMRVTTGRSARTAELLERVRLCPYISSKASLCPEVGPLADPLQSRVKPNRKFPPSPNSPANFPPCQDVMLPPTSDPHGSATKGRPGCQPARSLPSCPTRSNRHNVAEHYPRRISRAALYPGAPITPPPGCAPDPHNHSPSTGVL